MAILDIHQVSLSFGGLQALQNVHLKIEKGSTHALIGPNGAGKSTLLNVLTGMLKPDDGSVMFDGKPLLNVNSYDINQLGIAKFQYLQPGMALLTLICLRVALNNGLSLSLLNSKFVNWVWKITCMIWQAVCLVETNVA